MKKLALFLIHLFPILMLGMEAENHTFPWNDLPDDVKTVIAQKLIDPATDNAQPTFDDINAAQNNIAAFARTDKSNQHLVSSFFNNPNLTNQLELNTPQLLNADANANLQAPATSKRFFDRRRFNAVRRDFKDIFPDLREVVINDIDTRLPNNNRTMLLELCARNNNPVSQYELDLIARLIRNGADVNAHDAQQWTPLQLTHSIEVAQLLLNNRANPNLVGNNGIAPIHTPRTAEMAELLLTHGGNPNLTPPNSNLTPITLNMLLLNPGVVQVLLNHGARVLERHTLIINLLMPDIVIPEGQIDRNDRRGPIAQAHRNNKPIMGSTAAVFILLGAAITGFSIGYYLDRKGYYDKFRWWLQEKYAEFKNKIKYQTKAQPFQ